jgi:serine/threonine protein kinase
MELDHKFLYSIINYECSLGVVGTGYWRALEILEAVKNRTLHTTPNVFTPKSDVYSYAMTCYEILIGFTPFEDVDDMGRTSIDDVLQGRRPKLPSHLKPWKRDFFDMCWHVEPSKRPTFEEI